MKLKKKAITTTLAASLVVGSLAGVPVYAASVPSEVTNTLNKIYANLNPNEVKIISDARDAVRNLAPIDENLELINPIWEIVHAKDLAVHHNDPTITKKDLFTLIQAFAIDYDKDFTGLEALMADQFLKDIAEKLYNIVGGNFDANDDVADVVKFGKELQDKALAEIKKSTSLTDIKNAPTLVKAAIKDVIDNSTTRVAGILKNIGITSDAIISTKTNLEKEAAKKVEGADKIDYYLAVAYLKVLTDQKQDSETPTPGGGGGAPSDSPKGPDKAAATTALNDAAKDLAKLLEDKSAGLAKAVAAIQEALAQAATIDVSAAVKITDGKAALTLNASQLGDIFKTVKELADTANKNLKAAAADAPSVKVIATLDLGTVKADSVSIPLAKDVLAKAKEAGVQALAVKVNGVVLALDIDQLGAAAAININKLAASALPSTALAAASDVYSFTFEVDGKAATTFTKPVEIRLPITASGLDQELLSFTKIDGSNLISKGGKYDAAKKLFVVTNKSFSTYAVLENKISFNDIAGVKDWAGRQIAVAAAKGIIDGREEGAFVPAGNVTRAEFAKLIVKTFGLESTTAKEAFTDVNVGDWYQPYVAAASEAGLIDGRAEGIFAPNETITRAELATIASRALTKVKSYKAVEAVDTALAAFTDADEVNTSLKSGVAFAAEQALVVGQDAGKFNPNAATTRAEAAVVIYRLLNK
ncbi:S-layer homology domain-containing protein [Paenibacillus mesotrionivorans]|uniref:S-layer homology domain-containing protein n=1 Tax=Paenibacillus mesotrionivorans TaxID=3160968 RepID=A0ACC7NWF8_9BACL